MTSSKISQIAALMKSTELMNTQNKSQESDVAFGALLSQTAGGGNQDLFSWNGNLSQSVQKDSVNQAVYEKESAQSGYRESSITRSETSDIKSKLPDDTAEKLEAFEKKVTEVLSEKLGVTEEEVTEQMEVMGLTVLDLMDPSKLAGLVMELTGSEDIGSLLLSEDFQQLLGQMGELSQELMAQLNLTPEEMTQLMEQMETMTQESTDENLLVQDEGAGDIQPAVETDGAKQNAGTAQTAGKVSSAEQTVQNAVRQESAEADGAKAVVSGAQEQAEQQGQEEMTEDGADTSKDSLTEMTQSKGTEKAESPQGHITYQTTTQTINQGTVEVTQTVVQTRIDVEDIIRQVSQMTRVSIAQGESSIEMQLNPANLGKVYLQVISREGAITAQIAAQNEAVKEALESQITILKENMNQQGMKVEAIEVTIASHEFERNLEENQQNPANQQENETQKASRRNINLNNLDELEGLMSEEEDLVAKIMADNGNSVDLTA